MSQCIWIFILCVLSNTVNSMPPSPPKVPKFPLGPKPLITLSKGPMVPDWKDLESLLQVSPFPEKEETVLYEPLKEVLEALAEKAKENLEEVVAEIIERNIELEAEEFTISDEYEMNSKDAIVIDSLKDKTQNAKIKNAVQNSEMLTKIDTAVSKSKAIQSFKTQDIPTPSMVPIFKPQRNKMARAANLAIENQNSDGMVIKNPTSDNVNSISKAQNEIKYQTLPNESNYPRNVILEPKNCGNLEPILNGVSEKKSQVSPVDQSKVDFRPNSLTGNAKSITKNSQIPIRSYEESINLENLLVEALKSGKLKPVLNVMSSAVNTKDVSGYAIPSAKASINRPANLNLNYVNERSNENGSFRKVTSDTPVSKSNQYQADDAVLVLLKPETVSLSKIYGDFLKKLTLTVLVPISLSRL